MCVAVDGAGRDGQEALDLEVRQLAALVDLYDAEEVTFPTVS